MSMRGVVDVEGRRLLTRGPIAGGFADLPDPPPRPGCFDDDADDIFEILSVAVVFATLPSRASFSFRDAAVPPVDGSFSLMPGKRFSGTFPTSDVCV